MFNFFKKNTPHQRLIPQNLLSEENSNSQLAVKQLTPEEEIHEKFKTAFFQVYTESEDAVRLAKAETDQDSLTTIASFERKLPSLNGLMELFQLEPTYLRWGCNRDGSEARRMLAQLPNFNEKLTKLNNLKDTEIALIVAGVEEEKSLGRMKEINDKGYTLYCFEGITFLFTDRLNNKLNYNSNIYHELTRVKGTFDYDATAYIYRTKKNEITEFFRTSNETGEQYLQTSFQNERKIANPTDLIVKIEPPTKQEFVMLEEIILAFERRLIRMGFLPSNLVKKSSMEQTSFSRFMDNNFGTESKRRPCLVWTDEKAGVRMDDFEDAVEVLYLTNKILSNPKVSPFFNQ